MCSLLSGRQLAIEIITVEPSFSQKLRLGSDWKVFLKRGAVVGTIRVFGLLCVFLLQILLARLIGDTGEYGKYAWGQSLLFMLGTLAAMGIPIATGRFIASLSAQKKDQVTIAVVQHAGKLLLRSCSLLVFLALCLAVWSRSGPEKNFYVDLSALALILAPGVALMLLYQQICRARHWLILAFLPMQVLRPLTGAALATGLWWYSSDNLSGVMALVIVGLSVFVVGLPQAILYHVRQSNLMKTVESSSSHSDDYHPARLFSTSFPIFVTRIAGMLIEYSNVLLLGYLAGPAAAGAYFAAERLAQLASVPASIVSSVTLPDMAAANAVDNYSQLQSITMRTTHTGLWPTAVIVTVLGFLADPLLGLFGDGFSSAAPILVILVIGVLVKAALGPVQELLMMTGKEKYLPPVLICTAIIHLLFLWALVPSLGAVGAALTSTFSGMFASFWLMHIVQRKLSINPTILARMNNL